MPFPPLYVITSFAFGDELPAANRVEDVRWMPDPMRTYEFRDLSGLDEVVRHWLFAPTPVRWWFDSFLESLGPLLADAESGQTLRIAIGGRSVAVAEHLAAALRTPGASVFTWHPQLQADQQKHQLHLWHDRSAIP